MLRIGDTILRLETLWRFILDWSPSTGHKHRPQHDKFHLQEPERLTSAFSVPQQSVRKNYFTGWRLGVTGGGVAASVVFLINLIVTIILGSRVGANGLLFEGDCDYAYRINNALHIVINVLSTVLLSSSSYCMQCLSAPTRKEVDAAHAQGRWLDIGVLSVRNLRRISTKRVVLWSLLGLSSLPLHLLYNSAIFMSVASYNYSVFAIRQSFVGSEALNEELQQGEFKRLENIDCINAYAKTLQWSRGDVYLVVNDVDTPLGANKTSDIFWRSSFNSYDSTYDSYQWICSAQPYDLCDTAIDQIKANATHWAVSSYPAYPVQYCLSKSIDSQCKIRWNLSIAGFITGMNLVKIFLIFYTAFGITESPLMTMGDAVSSFLEKEDGSTTNMCITSIGDIKMITTIGLGTDIGPRKWADRRYKTKDGSSGSRRTVTFLLISASFVTVAFLFARALSLMEAEQESTADSFMEAEQTSLRMIAQIGFGAIDTRGLINSRIHSVIGNVLVANSPQVFLSAVYFSYNSLFTCMLLGWEWASYVHERKGLRVSAEPPRGAQRSSYFLSLPYRFALPIMAVSGLLHWLVSQSIFIAVIDFYDAPPPHRIHDDNLRAEKITCGYSPMAMMFVIVVTGIMLIIGIGAGFVRYPPGTNLVGSCSIAISAACHPPESAKGPEIALKRLKWGAVEVESEEVGHCSFSSEAVELPKKGRLYAGYHHDAAAF